MAQKECYYAPETSFILLQSFLAIATSGDGTVIGPDDEEPD